MNNSKYQETVNIIKSLIDRYNFMYPDFLDRLNELDIKLSRKKPKHIFCKDDCLNAINIYENPYQNDFTISDCILSLYNWNKSKIIYCINNPIYYNDIIINKELILEFPYSSIYLDMEFPKTKYLGCFATITREKTGYSLQYFLLLNFVSYVEKYKTYALEPFLLTIQDGISVHKAFENACDTFGIIYNIYEKDIDKTICSYAVCNIFQIIHSLENKKVIKTTSANREITEIHANYSKSKEFNITYESKYQYITNKPIHGNGSQKSPHTRRSHKRHIKTQDKNGNIIEKVINVKESHIHENEEIIPSIKIIK